MMRTLLRWLAAIADSLFNTRPVNDLPPVELKRWCSEARRRHLKALTHHPHHYVVALGLTVFLLAIGAYETGAVYGAWAYAVLENISTID